MSDDFRPQRPVQPLHELLKHIAELEAAGRSVPCVNPIVGHYWLSEDREFQAAAVAGCQSCPALQACAAYVDRNPEPGGVWAGRPPVHGTQRRRDADG
ncbi:MAG: WhiB family transcriptional regulator [Aeromicrobium erythreum]